MRKLLLIFLFLFVSATGLILFWYISAPVGELNAATQEFTVTSGEGLRQIATHLVREGFIRSASGFYLIARFDGTSRSIKPGVYEISPAFGAHAILKQLVKGPIDDKDVTIREGATIYEIDTIFASAGVLPSGALIAFEENSGTVLEGTLFPETYRFFKKSTTSDVVARMTDEFKREVQPLLPEDPAKAKETLILASILEGEVPKPNDRRVVAGILLKRLKAGMPLQVDASICYIKQIRADAHVPCYPLSAEDFERQSSYNTYRNQGFPPHPISNPGVEAVKAALEPLASPYWYYLSDPKTGDTIFAKTLDEHNANRVKYLSIK